jgi:D-glucuronyl C5-epimerase C-terminus
VLASKEDPTIDLRGASRRQRPAVVSPTRLIALSLGAVLAIAIFASAALAPAAHASSAGLASALQPVRGPALAAAKQSSTDGAASRSRGHRARRSSAHAATSSTPLLVTDLQHLQRRKTIDATEYQHYQSVYSSAKSTLSHLSGTRHTELAAVLANVEAIALAKGLIASRLPLLFLTIERNREWWANDSLLSYGDRVSFPGSRLVWEYYTGQGIEVQWLGTFGEANGYYLSGTQNEALQQVLEEAEALASNRAGGIAWEYMFQFDGGSPPWTSGLSQGTGIQAFSRAAARLHDATFQKTAERALGIFQTPPPVGIRIPRTVEGKPAAEYLEYSFASTERILNGFIQSLNGLYDFTKLTGSPLGLKLFEEGNAEARVQVPKYNTGAWSMYDEYTESDLGYHELLAEFLTDLCGRTREGEPLIAPPGETTPETSPEGGGTAPPASAAASTASAGSTAKASTAQAIAKVPIPGDEIYCSTAQEFDADIHTAPVIKLLSKTLPDNFRAGVMFSLSKVSTISLVVRKGGKVVWTNSATVEGGKPKLLWVTPKGTGTYEVSASAVDLAGNTASTSGTVKLTGKAH